jgi:hypothetical protein
LAGKRSQMLTFAHSSLSRLFGSVPLQSNSCAQWRSKEA